MISSRIRSNLVPWTLRLAAFALLTGPLSAQSLPSYTSLNPMVQMRSGLTTLPWYGPEKKWHVSVSLDYGNAIEYRDGELTDYILDAELLNQRLLVARNVGKHLFLLGEASYHASYDGFLDGFLDWYHNLTGLHVAARSLRPKNEFDYELRIGEEEFHYEKASYFGDLRLGGGVRYGKGWQSAVWATVPTGSKPNGYRKGVASLNTSTLFHRDFGTNHRFTYEGSAGLGFTPKHGELRDWQRTVFFMFTQGVRARLVGPLNAFANIFYNTAYYRRAGAPDLDSKELTLDTGALLRFKRGPTWLIAMTQDLSPMGPAIDVAFRFGAYW
jgi:hypothetical protein